MILNPTTIAAMTTTPMAEYKTVSKDFFCMEIPLLAGAMTAQNHTRREQREHDDREEENNVARIQHASLKTVKVSHHTHRCDQIDHPRFAPLRQKIDHRRKSAHDQYQATHHRDDKTHHLA